MDLLRGTLDLLVLHILNGGNSHGYAIAKAIQAATDGVLNVEEGSLYPALYRMEKRGLISADWGITGTKRRAKFYELTSDGRAHLAAEHNNWGEFSTAVGKVLESN
jgi:transcriptional regulator